MSSSERPRLDLPPTSRDRLLDALSIAGVMLVIAVLVAVWDKLPARVPTHFGMSGAPNGWGSRNSLLLFAVVPLVIHIGLTVLAKFPHTYNYPRKVTPENAETLYRLGRSLIVWLRTEIVWLFAILAWQTVRVALHQASGLPGGFVFVPLVLIYGTVIYFIVGMYRAR